MQATTQIMIEGILFSKSFSSPQETERERMQSEKQMDSRRCSLKAKGKTFTTAQIYICMLNRSLRNPRKGKNKKSVATSSGESGREATTERNGYVRTSSRFFSMSRQKRKKILKIKGPVCVRETFRLNCGARRIACSARPTSDASTCHCLSLVKCAH